MADSVVPDNLGFGLISTTKTALYTSPENTRTMLTSFVATSIIASVQTLEIYFNRGGSSRLIARVENLEQYDSVEISEFGEVLVAGDAFEAIATGVDGFTFSLSGAKRITTPS